MVGLIGAGPGERSGEGLHHRNGDEADALTTSGTDFSQAVKHRTNGGTSSPIAEEACCLSLVRASFAPPTAVPQGFSGGCAYEVERVQMPMDAWATEGAIAGSRRRHAGCGFAGRGLNR